MPGAPRGGKFRFVDFSAIRAQLRTFRIFLRFMLWPLLRALWSGKDLRHVFGPDRFARTKQVLVVAGHYGSHALVDPFLHHHRGLGVRDFVFLDLSRDGGLADHLTRHSDPAMGRNCIVWRPRGPWQPWKVSHWLNNLRLHHADKRWCLSLDTTDAFVFYRCETRRIGDLTDFLETEARDHLYALVIEMYGAEPAESLPAHAAGSFLEHLPYFDPCGFTANEPGQNKDVITRGGPQRRILFKTQPSSSPALNRIPLVKWRWRYAYVAGTRLVLPAYLNTPHVWWHSNPTGCLLRFALLADPSTLATAAEIETRTIIPDDAGPAYPGLAKLRARVLKKDFSRRYQGSADLVDSGLLNPGQWF